MTCFLYGIIFFLKKCGKAIVVKVIFFISISSFVITQHSGLSFADDDVKRNLLILHSYHQTSPWTDRIMLGILSVLNKSEFLLDIHVEYLDVQRQPLELFTKDLENIYAKKYQNIRFDAIILSDDPAMNFILPRRNRLFHEVPVVFCGINDFHSDDISGHLNITGVNQHVDIKRTIELALKIKPNISHFLVITDTTSTGRANKKKFETDIKTPQFKKIQFELMDNFFLHDLKSRLGGLSGDSAVLVLRLHQTNEGRQFTPDEYLKCITDWCDVPVFKLWSPENNEGVMGGVMESGKLQGELAARYALRILKGEPASSIPVAMKSPNVTILNYHQLKRFNIPDRLIPEGVVIVNRPDSVFVKYRRVIITITSIIILMTAMIIVLFINVLSRKKAQKKVNEALLRQHELIKAANVGLWDWDLKTNKVQYSKEWKKQIGYEEEEISNDFEEWERRVHPEDLDTIIKEADKSIANINQNHKAEFRFRHKNGSYRWILTQASVLQDASGQPTRMIGSHLDITDQKEIEMKIKGSEERLLESNQLLGNILNYTYILTAYLDPQFNFIWVNRVYAEAAKRELSFFLGKNYFDLYPHEENQAIFQSVVNTGDPYYAVAKPFEHPKRGLTYWDWSLIPVKDSVGDVIGLVLTLADVTEYKKTEEALRASEEKYRTISETSPDLICTLDINSNVMFINSVGAEMYGYKPEHLLGKKLSEFVSKNRLEDANKIIKKALSHDQIFRGEFYVTHRKGYEFPVYFSVAPLKKDDKIVGILCTQRDLTEIKKTEMEKERLQAQLVQSQKMESIGVLAGGIAHDFNNILTVILGNVSMAKANIERENEMFDLLNEAEASSIRARSLSKQLLTFAKGGAPIKEIASMENIIMEASSFVLHGSKSSCEFSIDKNLWPGEVDAGQISQVINNIIINANQAMPNGGIIKIRATNLLIEKGHIPPIKPGRYIKISIEDQGIGIDKKHFSNIFDPYFTTKQNGSGLGLATSYSIIKRHGGIIEVESKLRIGTTFRIYLPASDEAAPEKIEEEVIRGRGKILVMDDEAPLRKMVGRMLVKLGYEPEFAKDGAEAIEMYKEAKEAEKPYDIVILDLTVPGGMGGKDTIQKLIEIDSDIKAIVSSGYSDDPVLSNYHEYGFKGMLPKPFESKSLSKVLNEVLEGEKE